jgi:predicted amino acid racemase
MELAILLTQEESAVVEHGEPGEREYDSLIDRLEKMVDKIDSSKQVRFIGLDEDNELYEVVIPTKE